MPHEKPTEAESRRVLSEIESRLDGGGAKALATAVSRAVRDGVLAPGDRLPSIRAVAHELALSPTTVSAAWSLLVRAGTLRTEGRRGTVVAPIAVPYAGNHGAGRYRQVVGQPAGDRGGFALDLSTGVPDERLLPGLGRAIRAVTTAGTPRSYLDDPILPELAEVLAETWPYQAPAMTVVDGAMDALDLLIRATVRYGDRAVVEHPAFPPLLDLLEAAGAEVVGVPLDAEGMVVGALADVVAVPGRGPVRAVLLQPRGHNPTGISTTPRRARALARVIGRTGALVVEDDSASAIAEAPDVTLGTHLPGQTVHIRSWSKSHGPDLRLAAMSGPGEVIGEIERLRRLGQGWSSRLLQRVLVHLLTDERSREEVATAKAAYAERRATLVAALAAHDIEVPGTEGLNIWVPVADEAAAQVRLATAGIAVAPGAPFEVLPSAVPPEEGGHIRVTAGLVARGHTELAEQLAAAAAALPWEARGR